MKKLIIIFVLFLLPVMLLAQAHGLQIAPKGGTTTWLGGDVQSTWGGQGGLDLGYMARWRVMRDVQMGLRTGFGYTYGTTQAGANMSNQYTRIDEANKLTIEYTTTAHATEQHRQMGLELPVLFAFQAHGFALNIGPKLLWILQDQYTQTIDEAHVIAYFPQIGVTVPDADPTGRIETPYTRSGKGSLSPFHVLLSAEIGYEWQIGNRYSKFNEQYIGIQLYADYGLWSQKKQNDDPFIAVTPIQPGQTAPTITIGSIFQSDKALNYFSAGLRLYYTIQSVDYPGHGWHKARKK